MSQVEIAHMHYTELENQLKDCITKRPDFAFFKLDREVEKAFQAWQEAKAIEELRSLQEPFIPRDDLVDFNDYEHQEWNGPENADSNMSDELAYYEH